MITETNRNSDPVKANSREPVELPPFPEPTFAALIEKI